MTPAQFAGFLATGSGVVLQFVAVAVFGGLSIAFTFIGIRRGINTVRVLILERREAREQAENAKYLF